MNSNSMRGRFDDLLRTASARLFESNRELMASGDLLQTKNVIDDGDLDALFAGIDAGLIEVFPDGRFNTLDRPTPNGHWALLSRSKAGGWYNAEYLPQIAAYVDAVLRLGYPSERVLFELPSSALQLDLAILDDDARVVILGEAKRESGMLGKLLSGCESRFGERAPDDSTKKRGDEVRQLAWRLWTVRPDHLWLIAPGQRDAYTCRFAPLRFGVSSALPSAREIGLDHQPSRSLGVPDLRPDDV